MYDFTGGLTAHSAPGVLRIQRPDVHELKCAMEYFEPVRDGRKPFEVRVADRPFKVG